MDMIHLQGIGKQQAIPANQLKVGMKRLYNFGYTGLITNIEPCKSGLSLKLTTQGSDGKLYTKTIRNDTLIAIA